MGQITRAEIVSILSTDNPGARADDVAMYADAFLDYREASANIRQHGNIVLHPRTGAPIENPYLKVKAQASRALQAIRRLRNVDRLWKREEGEGNPAPAGKGKGKRKSREG